MGLFDKAFGKKDEGPLKLNEREAFSAVCVLAVAADGVIDDAEVRRIIVSLAEKRLFRGQRMEEMVRLLNDGAKNVQKRGAAAVIEAAKQALSAELRETAFVLSADLVLADGEVDDKEKKFLEDFQKALGISDELALKIIEVVVMKNRG
ncbi:MAG: Tellurite resistance protein TerB [Dehalococcoidia bacterium]|nr:Tellurite resistance protein TerB [Dehalococcoidia bacterium]